MLTEDEINLISDSILHRIELRKERAKVRKVEAKLRRDIVQLGNTMLAEKFEVDTKTIDRIERSIVNRAYKQNAKARRLAAT